MYNNPCKYKILIIKMFLVYKDMQIYRLFNSGNFCYFNVIVQLFFSIEQIKEILKEEKLKYGFLDNFLININYDLNRIKISSKFNLKDERKILWLKKESSEYSKNKFINFMINNYYKWKENCKKISYKYITVNNIKSKPTNLNIKTDLYVTASNEKFFDLKEYYITFCKMYDFDPYIQQDVSEILNKIFDEYIEQVYGIGFDINKNNITELPPLIKLFGSLVESLFICKKCLKVKVYESEYRHIIYLDIMSDVQQSVEKFLNETSSRPVTCSCGHRFSPIEQKDDSEDTDVVNDDTDPKFETYRDTIHRKFTFLPSFLIFTLKRYNEKMEKNNQMITINENIEINDEKYELYSVILHSGETLHNGHFKIVIRKNFKKYPAIKWIECNDHLIKVGNFNFKSKSLQTNAYILVYRKC
ncbi:Ubiquitin carboxyl-terminal hydrolase [Spraguea lophii 42_110]|uniref:Ubiquitin carboxyl-terminal hydrolase n=1 Tax=Spraguea lophii (strain 42_110) TaxID=1358809 RepID=S7XH85_SPRLO|nr:Ubiquitin carboxyl-terminal hydrolase [Spraguea lophii 42_110]